jgi:hypothetical protein
LRQGTMDAFVALLLAQLSNVRCLYLARQFTRQTALVDMVLLVILPSLSVPLLSKVRLFPLLVRSIRQGSCFEAFASDFVSVLPLRI